MTVDETNFIPKQAAFRYAAEACDSMLHPMVEGIGSLFVNGIPAVSYTLD
jgi:hypothetical protein